MTQSVTLLIKEFVAFAVVLIAGINVQAHAVTPVENIGKQSLLASIDPRPTPEQIEKGRVLVAKILNVLETIPLMDSDAVMREFGVMGVEYYAYSTHVRAVPKDSENVIRDLGFIDLSVNPWERGEGLANFNGSLGGGACIQKVDIDKMLGRPYKTEPIVLIDRVPSKDFYPTSFSYSIERSPLSGFLLILGLAFTLASVLSALAPFM